MNTRGMDGNAGSLGPFLRLLLGAAGRSILHDDHIELGGQCMPADAAICIWPAAGMPLRRSSVITLGPFLTMILTLSRRRKQETDSYHSSQPSVTGSDAGSYRLVLSSEGDVRSYRVIRTQGKAQTL